MSCALCAAICFGQIKIAGTVVDESGQALAAANVFDLISKRGTISDEEGKFILMNVQEGHIKLEASYVGKRTAIQMYHLVKDSEVKIILRKDPNLLNQVVVKATRAGDKAPFTYTNLDKEFIEKRNVGQDIPYLLDATPSVVVTSDAGAGIGYTGMRIRGTDPTRINVTINGIPLNDAESQGVFWVDLPDFATSTNDIQIQRGVGTSTNGAGAFGATVNLNTSTLHTKPYAELSGTLGSFNTWKSNTSFGTGVIKSQRTDLGPNPLTGFTLDGRLSKIVSDGYIDRAEVDMDAYFVSAAFIGKKNTVRANVFSGHEVTYQAWNGVPAQWINDDTLRTFNVSGTDDLKEKDNPHDNEVDDYTQTHFQLLFTQELNKNWHLNINGHYTRGFGFFEQYKISENLIDDYGLICDTCIADTDLIRRRWLDNDFYGGVWSLNYASNGRLLQNTFGGAYNEYKGDHFGELIWAENMSGLRQNERYYFGTGDKNDFNVYNKTLYGFTSSLFGFIDLQYRRVGYEINGTDNDLRETNEKIDYNFFNPKVGITYEISRKASVYGSFAVAHREPNRSDFTDAITGAEPKPERLFNSELGVHLRNDRGVFNANIYHMQYKDQLALTGNINDVGSAIRINIPDSYRLGLELSGNYIFNEKINIDANATFSENRIKNFTEYIDNWDTGEQRIVEHGTTDIAFSPSIIAFARLNYNLLEKLHLSFSGKYVGEQFIDNTSNKNTVSGKICDWVIFK